MGWHCGRGIRIDPPMSFAGTLTGIVNSNERVSIGRVLAQPSFYHLKIIQMHGTVRGVKILMPHDPFQLGDPCYGSYTFMLEDETGVIEIDVLGDRAHCGTQSRTAVPDVTEGDMVIVQSRIHAPGEYVDKMTSPLPVQHTKTHAIAIRISHTTR